ncbi:DUF4232 domain-containing protein [Streptomyces sp. NBC_00233]|uniref:DUF4232 domain-containing protein n=1 Tax=Streptomyces sp. NBC_00233 TaxID=2975686 RepID=UPI00225928FF|nr:DUF4232 domain-containing protein [Streptomyces sp. NBC_00233]MCX5230066.1 DUF4232 domain-containing protein [Streptomyces sp. NBC_00233]
MSGRTTRTRLLAATTLAVAALSLTACGSGAAKDEGAATTSVAPTASATQPAETPTTTPTGNTTTEPGGSSGTTTGSTSGSTAGSTGGSTNGGSKNGGTTTGTTTGGKSGGTASAGSNGSGGNSGANASTSGGGDGASRPSMNKQCGAGNTKTTATPVARPLNHMLLTVTNTGSGLCDLLGYPVARFGEAQSVPPVIEETHPQAVVTLAPGESGYAGVILSAADGSGQHGYTTTSLTVGFTDGTTARPRLAGKGVYVDSSLRVTYWQSSMDDALN